jgi:hypothetical protein
MAARICPECAQGKCVNCTKITLDPVTDDFVACDHAHVRSAAIVQPKSAEPQTLTCGCRVTLYVEDDVAKGTLHQSCPNHHSSLPPLSVSLGSGDSLEVTYTRTMTAT